MSGRSLRRLPVLAQSYYIGTGGPAVASRRSGHLLVNEAAKKQGTDIMLYLNAMEKVIDEQAKEKRHLQHT